MNQFKLAKTSKKTITHTSLKKPVGKYHIDNKRENYELVYEEVLKKGLGIVEQHDKDIAEILVYDIDLKLKSDIFQKEEILNECKILIKVINEVINKYVETKKNNIESHVCMKEKLYTKEDQYYKIGIHIYYPKIFLNNEEREILYSEIINNYERCLKKQNLYNKLYDNKINNIIDSRIISKTGILIYGASKENSEPYKLFCIFDNEMKILQNDKSPLELSLFYSLHKNKWLETYEHNKFKIEKKETILEKIECKNINKTYEHIIENLSKERSDNYDGWIKVGICLSNLQKKEKTNLFPIFDKFSKNSNKYKKKETEETYNRLLEKEYDNISVASLYYMLKLDNIKEFNNLISQKLEHINEAYEIAKVIFEYYCNVYVCTEKGNIWYYFNNKKWMIDNNNNILHKNVIEILIDNNKSINRNIIEEIIYFCKILFANQNFENILESNNHLLCFDNGVYDLDKNIFRKPFLDDYCFLSTNYKFMKLNDTSMIENIINKILPKTEMRDYFLYHLSTCLHGHKNEQNVIILTGSGANGKSLMMSLMSKVLGQYYKQGNTTLLSRKRPSSSNAAPELIALKDKRIYILNETEHNDTIQTSMLKQLSGGDEIEARDLYRTPISFKCKAKMFLCCNDLPKIPTIDQGTWRRLRVIEFPSKFVDNPDSNKKNEYKKDISLEKNLDKYVNCFMNLLLHYYEMYKKNNFVIEEPEDVKIFTESYKNINDDVDLFISNKLEYAENYEINIDIVYRIYKEWYHQNYNNKCKQRTIFEDILCKKEIFDKKKKCLKHYKSKYEYEMNY